MDNCDIEWFALEMNRDHSVVFESASKYCISDSFLDHDGYSISSDGFLPTVVDVMVGREGCCKQITLACAHSVSDTLALPLLMACVLSLSTLLRL